MKALISVQLPTDKRWLMLNSLMCGGQPSKFMCRSLLEQNFSSDFPVIKLGNIKDVVVDVLDQRSCGGEFVAAVSLFGVEITKQRNSEKMK